MIANIATVLASQRSVIRDTCAQNVWQAPQGYSGFAVPAELYQTKGTSRKRVLTQYSG
jgi:hypothetical protein